MKSKKIQIKFIKQNKFAPTQLVWNECKRGARTTKESFPFLGNVDVPMMKIEAENFQYLLDSGKSEMMTVGNIYKIARK